MKKQQRVKQENKTRSLVRPRWYFLAPLLILVLSGAPERNEQGGPKITREELRLLNSLFSQVDPALPENSYMPEFMKEKLSWIFGEIKAKQLDVDYDLASEWPEIREAVLVSTYSGGRRRLIIVIDNLLIFLRVNGKLPAAVPRFQKNSFAAALVHEAVHLERDEAWFRGPAQASKEERIAEEFRASAKVDELVIVPFLKMGEPVHKTHTDIHNMLVDCDYRMPCPAFTGFVAIQK